MYNQLIGKAAGQSADISVSEPKKLLKKTGLNLILARNFMIRNSRSHNFYTIRLKTEIVLPYNDHFDGIVALDKETDKLHRDKLKANGFILGDSKLPMDDPRVIRLLTEELAMAAHRMRTSRA